MSKSRTLFSIFVLVAVTLTGGGFGALTGAVYSQDFWWVGMTAGGVSALGLAWLYLLVLSRMSPRLAGLSAWVSGTFVAVGCGVVCTIVAHGAMLLVLAMAGESVRGAEGVVIIGIIIGAIAGFILGGICTLAFVVTRRGWQEEQTRCMVAGLGLEEGSQEPSTR